MRDLYLRFEEKELLVINDGPGSDIHHPSRHLQLRNLNALRFTTETVDPAVVEVEATIESHFSTPETKFEECQVPFTSGLCFSSMFSEFKGLTQSEASATTDDDVKKTVRANHVITSVIVNPNCDCKKTW